ncbi:hypothetical protein MCOR03_003966 [Pyricularia oryzae]|nr:hypothetical protein MCOR19_004205 [Pyricularia oryzae]KAI6444955.1 hypothetical protein MCOR17_011077 [Pyricularia oryzae]KAI6483742.1 hypothetical protein MCOR18_004242 [Pyricularia oryzae]KAI6561233.1 hypothetical protein MCOR03_003966 [Pyricularia oryzae]
MRSETILALATAAVVALCPTGGAATPAFRLFSKQQDCTINVADGDGRIVDTRQTFNGGSLAIAHVNDKDVPLTVNADCTVGQSNDLPAGFKASGFPTNGVRLPSSEKPSGEAKSLGKRPKTKRPRDLSALVKGAAADLAV